MKHIVNSINSKKSANTKTKRIVKNNNPPGNTIIAKGVQITRLPEGKLIRGLMELEEFNRDLEQYQSKLSTFSFAMFRYKTSWWPKITQKHDWAQWIYAHRLQDFRRPPDIYMYEPEDWWVIIHKDWSWESWKEGIDWKYSHTTFERLYHPNKFKLVPWEKKVWLRDEMWAFYHKPEEKQIVEQESIDFYDPFMEEFDEEKQEDDSDHQSESKDESPISVTKISKVEIEPKNKLAKIDSQSRRSASKIDFEDVGEENVWANEEFGLEAALQKTYSEVYKKDSFDDIEEDDDPKQLKSLTIDNTSNTPLSTEDQKEDSELSKNEEWISTEIHNIALGNIQQIETTKIVEKIISEASSKSKSKFFNLDDDNDNDDRGDLIDDILTTDFSKILLAPENKEKPKIVIPQNNYWYDKSFNGLHPVKEENSAHGSSYNKNGLDDIFNFGAPIHRQVYSFGDKSNPIHFDIFNGHK